MQFLIDVKCCKIITFTEYIQTYILQVNKKSTCLDPNVKIKTKKVYFTTKIEQIIWQWLNCWQTVAHNHFFLLNKGKSPKADVFVSFH